MVIEPGGPWSPWAVRRDGQIFLRVPVWLGVADSLWDFEITAEQLAALAAPARMRLLKDRLDGTTHRDDMRTIIDDVCLG